MIHLFSLYICMSSNANLYESLYKTGYHSDLNLSHATYLVQKVHANATNVLDVGCSHGKGVSLLWKRGIVANGVDISPTAVNLANTHRKTYRNCGGFPCFQVASATSLPFGNKTFDTIISSDVLEHLSKEEVPFAVDELIRVGKRRLLLKIATKVEGNKAPLKLLHAKNTYSSVKALHLSVMPIIKWASLFKKYGYRVSIIKRDTLDVKLSLTL